MDMQSAAAGLPAPADRAPRHDGWTPDRQRAFLEAIAEGHTVGSACRIVGMAPSSAYALRRRAAGAAFALGWRAANLLAREKVADTLLARAIDGQVETVTRPDGETVTRHRYDNRLASTMLARLDRFADAEAGEATHQAARLVAAEFDGFLDLIERDCGPARTGVFLAARIAGDADPDLAAVLSLARADRWLRTGRGAAAEVDTHDLDPDARAGWTAEQWARAEAAGMIAFTAPDGTARHAPLSPLHPGPDAAADEDQPVWWDDIEQRWRTRFPPPDDFFGDEEGDYGDEGYERSLSDTERYLLDAEERAVREAMRIAQEAERDRWFNELAAAVVKTERATRAEVEARSTADDAAPGTPAQAGDRDDEDDEDDACSPAPLPPKGLGAPDSERRDPPPGPSELLPERPAPIEQGDGHAPVARVGGVVGDHRLAVGDAFDTVEPVLGDPAGGEPLPRRLGAAGGEHPVVHRPGVAIGQAVGMAADHDRVGR